VVFDLLVEKPEREDKLLEMLVNKLGDPEKKMASKACGFLVRLLQQHPNMASVPDQRFSQGAVLRCMLPGADKTGRFREHSCCSSGENLFFALQGEILQSAQSNFNFYSSLWSYNSVNFFSKILILNSLIFQKNFGKISNFLKKSEN
jgi:hypothetical protein